MSNQFNHLLGFFIGGISAVIALVILTNGIETLKTSVIVGFMIIVISALIGCISWILLNRALKLEKVIEHEKSIS